MKNNLLKVLAITSLVALSGCGGNTISSSVVSTGGVSVNTSENSSSINYNDGKYRVIILLPNGERAGEGITAQWCQEDTCKTATTNSEGVATIELEDGDYDIHLPSLPEGYAYQPGQYFADKDNKTITIKLDNILTPTSGDGTAYNFYNIGEGVYRTTVESAEDIKYYGFTPVRPGKYKIESWTDTTDRVNAAVAYYGNNPSFVPETPVDDIKDDDSGFNDNFLLEFNVGMSDFIKTGELDEDGNHIYAKDENGNLVAGAISIFGVSADVKRAKSFNFAITYLEEYVETKNEAEEIKVTASLTKYPEPNSDEVYKACVINGTLNAYYNEDDGYYHAKSVDGPIIVAKISEPCPYLELAFSKVNDKGVNEGILGTTNIILDNGTKNYSNFVKEYEKYCNSDGVYGVNQELKTFLEYYYINITSWLDSFEDLIHVEEAGWMFACGYYTDIADSYTTPLAGTGTESDPYVITFDEYYANIEDNSSVYYTYGIKNPQEELTVFVKSSDANAKFIYNGNEYSSETGAYFEVVLGGSNLQFFTFEVTTTNNQAQGVIFEIAEKEVTVAGDAISIGENTVEVPKMGMVECSYTISRDGAYTVSSEEKNGLFYFEQTQYSGKDGLISFSKEYKEGDILTFTVYTENMEADYITFELAYQPVARLGINQMALEAQEAYDGIRFVFTPEEDGNYKVTPSDGTWLGIEDTQGIEWVDTYTFENVKANEVFSFVIATSSGEAGNVRFTLEKI